MFLQTCEQEWEKSYCTYLRVLFKYEISFRKLLLEWMTFSDKIYILSLAGMFYDISLMDKNKYCPHDYKETKVQIQSTLCQTVTVWQLMKSSLFDICKRMCWQGRFNSDLLLTKANYISLVELFCYIATEKRNQNTTFK